MAPAALAGVLLAALLPAIAAAGPCDPATLTLDRGERRSLILCAAGLPADAAVGSLPTGVTVHYQQPLRRCNVGEKRPGLHLVLDAAATASSGTLTVGTGEGRCDLAVTVPERLLLPPAELWRRSPAGYRLEIPLPDDVAPGCGQRISFPATTGIGLRLDPASPEQRCRRGRLELDVVATDARPQPAKVVVSGLRLADGRTVEGISHATPPAPAWTADMAEKDARWIDVPVDGERIRTRYFEAGKGEAILLVHGGQPSSMDGTAWDWQQNFGALSKRFHVYALDRIGQGYTANPANLDAYNDYYLLVLKHVLGFMDVAGIGRAHLVGHSQGSWPVTRLAIDYPDRVASLTLVDGTMASPPKDGGSALQFYLYLSQFLHPKDGETLESARRGMEFFSYSGNNLTEQRVERLYAMTKQPKYHDAVAWFAKSMMSPAHPKFRALKAQLQADVEAGKLTVPVLLVWGANDPEGSLPSGLEMFRLVGKSSSKARMHIFGRSGHLSHIEYPEEFNQVLIDFASDGR